MKLFPIKLISTMGHTPSKKGASTNWLMLQMDGKWKCGWMCNEFGIYIASFADSHLCGRQRGVEIIGSNHKRQRLCEGYRAFVMGLQWKIEI